MGAKRGLFSRKVAAQNKVVVCYARNDHLEFSIPYEYLGVSHAYFPDYVVLLTDGTTLLLEIKGLENDQDRANIRQPNAGCGGESLGQAGALAVSRLPRPADVGAGNGIAAIIPPGNETLRRTPSFNLPNLAQKPIHIVQD